MIMQQRNLCARDLLLALFLFLFWASITASCSLGNIILGVICSLISVVIAWFIFSIRLPEDITLGFLVRLPVFVVVLAWEVIKANLILAFIVIRPRLLINPQIFRFKTKLEGEFRQTMLADSITLTPGTLTVDAQDDLLFVHCLDNSYRERLSEGRCEHLVAWLFEGNPRRTESH